jgi:spermidine synthase
VNVKRQAYLLEIVVFVSGAVVMILELTGSRILAPHVGGSLPVWTGLIGVILGSLSLGYMLGGRLADKNPTHTGLTGILFQSSVTLAVIPILSKVFLPVIIASIHDIKLATVIATIFLFALPSVLLGMVSPYVIRLKLESVASSGVTAGRLYAISTVGSILGTFFAGFFLIAYFGSHTILYLLSAAMLVLSVMVMGKKWWGKIFYFIPLFLILAAADYSYSNIFQRNVLDVDTQYNRVIIKEGRNDATGRTIREMMIGNEPSSAMYTESDELVYSYTKYYRLLDHFAPETKSALMLGGAGYSYPKDFIRNHPEASIDIVEIDPALTELAKKYFAFQPNDKTTVYHEDARTFLNREEKKYDAILNDAFSSHFSHPFQLASKEAIQHMYDMLTDDGVVITNTIATLAGERGKFLRAEYYTYKSVFPYVAVFPVATTESSDYLQNVMIIAAKKPLDFSSDNPEFKQYLRTRLDKELVQDVPIFTDDYAPVEHYAANLLSDL